ncbi:hypothetical protein KDL45_18260, partial [bacterium]|nr:hypothetical protein [bacterium]
SDGTVADENQQELIEQWTNVAGTDADADVTDTAGDVTRRGFEKNGTVVVEAYTVTGMAHAVCVGRGDPTYPCGPQAASYYEDHGTCSTYQAARFFGLTGGGGGGGGGGDDDSSNVSSSDDDAVDDDTSDDDAGDDDTLDDDDSANDDDTADDDDTTYYAPCPRGYTIPDGASKGGCVTQIDGGAAGLYGIAIDVDSQNMPNILGAKGREIVVYTPPPDEPTPLEYPKSYT